MPKITSQKCSKMFSLLTPVLLWALALPMAFAPLQANIFVSAAHAAESFGPGDPGYDGPVLGNDTLGDDPSDIKNLLPQVQGSKTPGITQFLTQHTYIQDYYNRLNNSLVLNNALLNLLAVRYTSANLAKTTTTLTNITLSNPALTDVVIDWVTGGAGSSPVTSSTGTTLSVPNLSTDPQISMPDIVSTSNSQMSIGSSLAATLPPDALAQIQSVTLNPSQYSAATVAFADMLVNGSFGQGVMLSPPTLTRAFGSPTEEEALVAQFVSKFVDEVFGSPQVTSGWSVFLTPYGNASLSTDGSSHGNTYGVSGGLTHIFNEKFSLGMHFDLGSSQNFAHSLSTESRTFTGSFGVNANYKFTPEWYVGASFTTSFSNTYNDYKTASSLGTHSADNNHGGYSLVAALNTGYIFQINKNHALIPEIGLSYVYSHTDANDITWNNGGSFLNMYNDATNYDALYGNIALRWLGTFEIDENSTLKPFVSVGLRQNLSGHNMQSSMVYAGTRYNNEATPDMTTFTTTAGVEWVWKNFSVNLNYNGAYGTEKVNHGGALTLGWSF